MGPVEMRKAASALQSSLLSVKQRYGFKVL